ncbi:MAG: hypothetical protein M1284_03600, partial [Candidatus Parvarchaeota archaeon]|nr:hypothetical protein [Candidatus Parvarchaeota archaeon]
QRNIIVRSSFQVAHYFLLKKKFHQIMGKLYNHSRLQNVDPHSPEKIRGLVPVLTHPKFEEIFKNKSRLGRLPKKYPNLNMW